MNTLEETIHVLRRLLETQERDIKRLNDDKEKLQRSVNRLNDELESAYVQSQRDHAQYATAHDSLCNTLEDLFTYQDLHGPLQNPMFDLTTINREGLKFRLRRN